MKKVVLALCIAAAIPAFAQEEEWIEVTSTDVYVWHAKKKSGEAIATKGGKSVYLVIGRITNKKTKLIELTKWYVEDAHCDEGLGKFVTLSVDGKYLYENDFVLKSGTVASRIAELICVARDAERKRNDDKGI